MPNVPKHKKIPSSFSLSKALNQHHEVHTYCETPDINIKMSLLKFVFTFKILLNLFNFISLLYIYNSSNTELM